MEDDRGMRLRDSISIGDMLQKGSTFEFNTNDWRDDIIDDGFDNYDEDDDEEQKEIRSPWTRPFDELRDQMTQLSDTMWKRIIKPGTGDVVPENSRVTVDYNAFFENQTEAFDSTYLRGQPQSFICKGVLPGMYNAVRTMQVNEEAQFLISYEDLYGELGSPPRIPPAADGLYIIKLHKFSELGDVNGLDELPESERTDFQTVHTKALEVLKSGLEMFNKGHAHQAVRAFVKSARSLEICQMKDEAEQAQQEATLKRLYTNLAVCYNKLEMYPKTCLVIQDLGRLCDIKRNSKVLFCEGRANLELGNFRVARTALEQCQRLVPNDRTVAAEIVKLNDKYKKYLADKQKFCSNAFKNLSVAEPTNDNAKEPAKDDVGEEYKTLIFNYLDAFLTSNEPYRRLNFDLSDAEVESIQALMIGPYAALELTTSYVGDRKIYALARK